MKLTQKVIMINTVLYLGISLMLISVITLLVSNNYSSMLEYIRAMQEANALLFAGAIFIIVAVSMTFSHKCPHCAKRLPLSRYCFCNSCGKVLDEDSAIIMREYISDSVPIGTGKILNMIKNIAVFNGIFSVLVLAYILLDGLAFGEQKSRGIAILAIGTLLLFVVVSLFINHKYFRCPYCDKKLEQSKRFGAPNYCHCCGEETNIKVLKQHSH